MTPEKRVQNSIINYLKKMKKEGKPVYVERRQAGGFSYKMGIADVYTVIDGFHIEIEVKAPGGKLRPMQEKWKQQCEENNIFYICSDNVDDFIQKINDIYSYIQLCKQQLFGS